jgi:choline dehydrogenase-like flavoprotein
MQVVASRQPFDAVVVGSGATGGWAAKKLTAAGMRVALLEAGAKVAPKDFTEHVRSWQMPFLGYSPEIRNTRPIQSLCYACRETNYQWFVNDLENPYTQDKPFLWIRMRTLGGRSLSWGRQSYRMSDLDFKAASHDGYGDDWPISYADLVPYYEEVERYVGISGTAENLPQLPDSIFLPGMAMTCGEQSFKLAVQSKTGRRVTIGRAAILTRPHNGRQACHYCGPCEQGCATFSYFSSPFTTIKDAQATGRLTLITDAVCSHILVNDGKAAGVGYIDRTSRAAREVRGKIVVLCASTLESTRLMLNSGIGGESGVLGHYLMDHVFGGTVAGVLPEKPQLAWSGPPQRPNGIYIPRFRNVTAKTTNGFIRGYGFQGGASPQFRFDAPGFGPAFKDAVRESQWVMSLIAFGECLARKENRVEIDPDKKDAWGVPTLKISAERSDNDFKLYNDAQDQAAEMLEAAGATSIGKSGQPSTLGFCIHEVGTARMGNDPKSSVFNRYCQSHELPNLFCTDGAVWTSTACQNPTLTMMAITVRACDYMTREYAKIM